MDASADSTAKTAPTASLLGRPAITYITLVALVLAVTAVLAFWKLPMRISPLWAAGAIWIFFMRYWLTMSKSAAPTKSAESRASRRLHEVLLYGSLILNFVPVPGLTRRFLPLSPWVVALGLAVLVGCSFFAVWARQHLGQNWSAIIAAKVDHELVRSGPYRLVRHPIYSGMLGMFLGTAIVSGRIHALLALAIISVAYYRKIRIEEERLRSIFGAAYDDYRQTSWALIPGLL
jgi:protein-S-isoprenylcysteine O-methyltransferase Ste14